MKYIRMYLLTRDPIACFITTMIVPELLFRRLKHHPVPFRNTLPPLPDLAIRTVAPFIRLSLAYLLKSSTIC